MIRTTLTAVAVTGAVAVAAAGARADDGVPFIANTQYAAQCAADRVTDTGNENWLGRTATVDGCTFPLQIEEMEWQWRQEDGLRSTANGLLAPIDAVTAQVEGAIGGG